MMPYFTEDFANPASAIGHFVGLDHVVTSAKQRIARSLNAESAEQIVITSGATEANNLAILGAARANPSRRHLIVSTIEHPSVLEVARYLESIGYRLSTVPVDKNGIVVAEELRKMLTPETLLVSIMLANNETGVVSPIRQLCHLVKNLDPTVLFHTDATQAVSKIPVDLANDLSEVDLLSLSAHKFHGPKGIGALFLRDMSLIQPTLFGGGQQNSLRSGTENPAGIIGMAQALVESCRRMANGNTVGQIRTYLEHSLTDCFPSAIILGAAVSRLPNTCYVCLPGINGGDLVDYMASQGIAISVGSACAHGAQTPSYVARAMGLDYVQAQQCVRISLSTETSLEEIALFLNKLKNFPSI